MVIIHLSSTLGGGGAEQMVLQLAKQSNANIKTIVISLSDTNIGLESRFQDHNIEYHLLGVNSFRNSTLISGLKKLKKIIDAEDEVVLHSHMYHGFLLGLIYKLCYKNIPIVFTLHSSAIENFGRKLMLHLTKPFRKQDIVFSNNAKMWYLKKNSEVIPNGVNFDELAPAKKRVFNSNDVFIFLYLGRLNTEKNPLQMVSAAQQLLKHNINNFVINFVGGGIMHDELVDSIESNNLSKHFNILGFQNDIKPFLAEAHCLVLPSLWEGMPVVLIEAAAAKLPIVSTPVGSIPDFLNDSNAYVTELDTFHKSMIDVYEDYDLALQKSAKLYTEIESQFKIENVFAKHLSVYQKSLKTN
ncbi:glycosyltransferase [Psychroserpens ponticola]|uniref:Glycosyltransferase n=1 Tax=Psychroserpens ponticola TaxID=2932268 RepID=A0ABY7S133_9FLAO|nr:glycosyltransferase [Psychroserpens ponticola]WCO03098.1 glycosyltransferase [Psychroserpens ponticola]